MTSGEYIVIFESLFGARSVSQGDNESSSLVLSGFLKARRSESDLVILLHIFGTRLTAERTELTEDVTDDAVEEALEIERARSLSIMTEKLLQDVESVSLSKLRSV